MCKKAKVGVNLFKNLADVLQMVKILSGDECLQLFTVPEKDACSLLHIGRAERPTNGVWEISVLYPQGPVLHTQIA